MASTPVPDHNKNIYLPRSLHSSTLELFGVTVRVYTLDDGRRVVHADDTAKLLEQMNERHITS